MPINSLFPLSKDTGHSCVFDWPDRAGRPGLPPPDWVPPFPHGPGDDWDPTNPLDNGVPGSNPNPFDPTVPPSTVHNAFYIYASFQLDIALAYNCRIQSFQGPPGTNIIAAAGPALNDQMVGDPFGFAGGDENHSSVSMGSDSAGKFNIVLNFYRMKVNHPTVDDFQGGFFVQVGYLGNHNWHTIVKHIRGTWPATSVNPVNVTKDYTFSGYTGIDTWNTFDHFVVDATIPLMGWTYNKPSGDAFVYFP